MMIRMNVGCYKGEIRGPFHSETAKMLIARGDASPTESIGDGQYRVVEIESATASVAAEEQVSVAGQTQNYKKKGSR
ncbi:MAG TPA: hypothetical protein VGQ12_12670 [Candidatus Angelobacter sp.]|jgi:hypothetical protein|nr:hypothetical protein [Candidatus Angelobacter sp.]